MLRGSRVLPTRSTKMLLAINNPGVPTWTPTLQETKDKLKAFEKKDLRKRIPDRDASSVFESEAKDSSDSKEPKLKSLRTGGAASNTYANREDLSTVEGSTERNLAQPKWVGTMLRIENKLAALREQLSREKPPDHVASYVLGHIDGSLSNLKFPISDLTIAMMHFKEHSFRQQPLESLYYSLRLSRRHQSVITPTVGLAMARLCGLNERSATGIRIHDIVTFEPSDVSKGPDPFNIALLAGRIDVAKLIIEEDKQHSRKYYDCWDAMTVSCDGLHRVRASRESTCKMSPVQLISAFGEPEALRYLLSVEVDRKHDNQWTPLHFAAFFGKVDNMKVLVDEGYAVNWKTGNRPSPLHLTLLSSESSSFDAFSLLLEKGADVNEPDREGVTPLHLAAEKDDIRFMEALLVRDADVKRLANNIQSPLHKAAKKGNVKALEALLARGSDMNGLCKYEKKSPLHYAIEGEHDAAAEFLITKGAKVTVVDAEGRTPLHIAIGKGSARIVKLLLAKGVGIRSGDSFLVDAAAVGNVEVIEALIAAGASPCTEHKTPPWLVAAYHRKEEAFPILLAYSVSSVSGKKKKQSLMLKKQYSEQLLSGDDYGDVLNGNALHWACRMGDVKSASLLIEKGANVNDTNCTRDRTALYFAAEHNHVDMIKFLVSKGADIQGREGCGWSPLHSAAYADNHEAMAALVALGADLTVKTKAGDTPLETYRCHCYGQGDDGVVSLLTPKHDTL